MATRSKRTARTPARAKAAMPKTGPVTLTEARRSPKRSNRSGQGASLPHPQPRPQPSVPNVRSLNKRWRRLGAECRESRTTSTK